MHVLRAVLDELDRRVEQPRQVPGQHAVLDAALDAVAAAHVHVEVHAHLVGRQPQRVGELVGELRHLDRGPHVQQVAGAVPPGHHAERLQRHGGVAVPAAADAHRTGRARPVAVHVTPAELAVRHDVGAVVGMHQRRVVACGHLRVDHRRQRLVVDRDELGAVFGDGPRRRHDGGHPLAGVPGRVDGEGPPLHGRDVQVLPQRIGVLGQLRAGQHGHHAVQFQRLRRIDAGDAGVRIGAGDQADVQRAGRRDVGDEPAAAGDEPAILTHPAVPRHPAVVVHGRTSSVAAAGWSAGRPLRAASSTASRICT